MRTLVVALTLLLVIGREAAGNPETVGLSGTLDARAALDKLEASDPERYRLVITILRSMAEDDGGKRWEVSATDFGATTAWRSAVLLTSYPAQWDFSFKLGDTTYWGRMTPTLRARVMGVSHRASALEQRPPLVVVRNP